MASMQMSFVLGGARSGKSRFAEGLVTANAAQAGLDKVYIATAQALDDEMQARIRAHQEQRGSDWTTIDAPFDLPAAIRENAVAGRAVLIDCLTLWLSNLMLGDHDTEAAAQDLLSALTDTAARVVLVSNEVGLGVVPENALARRFRDAQGKLNQLVADSAGHVVFVAAGLPLVLKGQQC